MVYKRALIVFKENRNKVDNPFEKMIHSSEICELMNKNFYTLDISIQRNYKQQQKINFFY